MSFYDPRVIDSRGGYHQNFHDDGSIFNDGFKHLVSSTRMVVNYATAASVLDRPQYLEFAQHGLDYIENVHWQTSSQGYAWTLQHNTPTDMTQQAYGYAFVLLAYAAVCKAGLVGDSTQLHVIYERLEKRFWQAEYGLYADTISVDGELSDYRGQNANMHLCEAMIAAFEACKNSIFLEKANLLARNICARQADLSNGLVWEHFTSDFGIDWEYNKDDPKNLYRPWGFQPGHQTEWAKLLLQLNGYSPDQWLVDKAQYLFDTAYEQAWDSELGGLIYGFNLQGEWCDDDKYFWVQAESIAAAAMLYQQTEQAKYLAQYEQLWRYCWEHFVDHEFGAWFRVLRRDNVRYSKQKSAAGAKCDYHTLGAFMAIIELM